MDEKNKIVIKGVTYVLTYHALHRMKKRFISYDQIFETLRTPKAVRKDLESDGEVFRYIGKKDIIVVVAKVSDTYLKVITCLYGNNKSFAKAKAKREKNKNRVKLKRQYGSRIRK